MNDMAYAATTPMVLVTQDFIKDVRELLDIFIENYIENEDVPLADRLHDALEQVMS